jgi:hypothetical protein
LLIVRAADTVMPTAISIKISIFVAYRNPAPEVKEGKRRCVAGFAPWPDFTHREGAAPG